MTLEHIRRREFNEPDRVEVQESVARAVESDPERFIARYEGLEQSLGGRYVSADLFKETFEQYSKSKESRNRYNSPTHNAAAVLASEQLRRMLSNLKEPERDTVVLLTGIPGAGKTSSVLKAGELPANICAVYEGQLADPGTALAKVQQVLDSGLKPVIVAVHATPERALENTLQRFNEVGRGASIGVMTSIQAGLPDGLQAIRERFGNAVQLQIVDRRIFHEPRELEGWQHLNILRSEGAHEQIRRRLDQALEQHFSVGRIDEGAYRQALGKAPRSPDQTMDLSSSGRDENARDERGRATENRQEALLTASAAERLRLRSDQVAERLAAEREQERARQRVLQGPRADERELSSREQEKSKQLELDRDRDVGLER